MKDHCLQSRRWPLPIGQGLPSEDTPRTSCESEPMGLASQNFLNEVLPVAPDVPVQIAHLTGAGAYDDPLVDQALAVFVDAIANHDRRMRHVCFDVSGVVGYGNWAEKANLIATRIRQLGIARVLYDSDGAGGGNLVPRATTRRAISCLPPLDETSFRPFSAPCRDLR